MSTEEQRFLKFLVQASRIRQGVPDSVIGFNTAGKPEVTLKSSLGGGGTSLPNLVDPTKEFWFYDEFFYPRPNTEFPHFDKSVASINAFNTSVGGVISYGTSSVTNNISRINICGAGMTVINANKRMVMRCKIQQLIPADHAMVVGFFEDQSNGAGGTFPFNTIPSPQSLFFRSNGTGNNYFTETDDNITPTSVDTGVAVDNVSHVFEIDINPALNNMLWKIDGNIVRTQTTDIPNNTLAWYANHQTGVASSKFCLIDTLFIFNER